MKVTVVALNAAESRKAMEGLTKLGRGIKDFRKDWKDQRVDAETIESFVKGLRVFANYFEGLLADEPEVEPDEDEPEYVQSDVVQ
jgi:hypothetical protein